MHRAAKRRVRGIVVALIALLVATTAIVLIIVGQTRVDTAQRFNEAQASKEAELPPVALPVGSSMSTATLETSEMTSSSSAPASSVSTDTPVGTTESETIVPSPSSTRQTVKDATTAKPTKKTVKATKPSPIQKVAAAPPTRLSIQTITHDLSLSVIVDAMPYNSELAAPSCTYDPDPKCPEKAYWVKDTMGVAPGSSTVNSTYIVGHSWTISARVFDKLSNYGMTHYAVTRDKAGNLVPKVTRMASVFDPSGKTRTINTWKVPGLMSATVVVKTANGTLTYKVSDAYVAKKSDIGNVHEFQHGAPNTVMVETCGIDAKHGVDTEYGVVVMAKLVAATSSRS